MVGKFIQISRLTWLTLLLQRSYLSDTLLGGCNDRHHHSALCPIPIVSDQPMGSEG